MYVKVSNGAVDSFPYGLTQLRRDNPNTSFPKSMTEDMLNSFGVYSVQFEDVPSYNERTQKAEQATTPSEQDGSWVISWTVSSKTDAEVAEYDEDQAASMRSERNTRLQATDYLALSDNTMTTEMATYRQALRDITSHANWPHLNDDDWPVKP